MLVVVCISGGFKMHHNELLYVFGFALHILRFKAQKPIGKTDIYNVLTTGGFNPPTLVRGTKKIK